MKKLILYIKIFEIFYSIIYKKSFMQKYRCIECNDCDTDLKICPKCAKEVDRFLESDMGNISISLVLC